MPKTSPDTSDNVQNDFGKFNVEMSRVNTLSAYNLGVVTPRALVHAGDKTSGDVRSWYMISGDANAARPVVASRGGRTCGRAGRGGGRTRGRSSDRGNGGIDGQCGQVGDQGGQVGGQGGQVGGQGSDQGNGRNQNGDAVNDNIQGDVRNIIENNDRRGCAYKEFLACNPKEYDGKGGVIVYTRLVEKMESVQDMSGYRDNQKVKYTAGSFIGKALTWWNSQIHTRGREAAIGMSWEDFKTLTREEFCPSNEMQKLVPHLIAGTLTNEALRNGSIKKNSEKRGIRENLVKIGMEGRITRELGMGMLLLQPQTLLAEITRVRHPSVPPVTFIIHLRHPVALVLTVTAHDTLLKIVKSGSEARGNHQNQVMAVNRGQGHRNDDNQAYGRAFMLGSEEARQDPNIMTGTFTLNNHYATTLFNSIADYSFVSTTFIPLLSMKPSDLGFSYEIEIASRQLVEIDKVIKGCKLEIEGHMFDINLIPFGSESFDVIIGMDWLSNHKAKIICHEKVVRIPLPNGKVLRVIGERPEEKMRHVMSAKAKEQKQKEIVVVRDFPRVFLDDLS
ncbi:putative reverse transcriptase domain-containing protein [Tanacetum coccineum]|uniref:Reverse transcriptase domain-containing protein n=1 Tax=Tanacetum coccineum TaxID=301880 RepID=A0ABQ5HYC3_9ASTR